jgi:hypothetical protein
MRRHPPRNVARNAFRYALAALGLAGGFATLSGMAHGADAAAGADRYVLERLAEGYLRLDRTTGATDFCAVKEGSLACAPAAEERAAMDKRIADLTARVGDLEAQLKEAGNEPPQGGRGEAENNVGPPAAKSREEEEFEKSLNFAERALRRFFDVIRELKTESGKTAG